MTFDRDNKRVGNKPKDKSSIRRERELVGCLGSLSSTPLPRHPSGLVVRLSDQCSEGLMWVQIPAGAEYNNYLLWHSQH